MKTTNKIKENKIVSMFSNTYFQNSSKKIQNFK